MADVSTGSFDVGMLSASYRQEGTATFVMLSRKGVSGVCCAGLGVAAEDLAGVVAQLIDRGLVQLPITPAAKRAALAKRLEEGKHDVEVNDPGDYPCADWLTDKLQAVVVTGTLNGTQMKALMAIVAEFFADDEVVYR